MPSERSFDTLRETETLLRVCRKGGSKKEQTAAKPVATAACDLGKQVDSMPQFASLGARFKSCAPLALTDEDTEYVVTCVKHVYPAHTVLQFNCTNTFTSQVRIAGFMLFWFQLAFYRGNTSLCKGSLSPAPGVTDLVSKYIFVGYFSLTNQMFI